MAKADDKLAWFPFYVLDFAGDEKVEAMSTLAVGAYILLLCKAWHATPAATIPTDDEALARLARVDLETWRSIRPQVLACFVPCADGRMVQPRLEREYRAVRTAANTRTRSAMAAAKARWDAEAMRDGCDSQHTRDVSVGVDSGDSGGGVGEPRPDPIVAAFAAFWRAWTVNRVGKGHARAAFAKAAVKARPEVIIDAAEEFQASPSAGKYCPHPTTWLNAERWADDRAAWWRDGPADARAAWLRRRHGLRVWLTWTPGERVKWGSAFLGSLPTEGSGAMNRRAIWQEACSGPDPEKFAYAVVEYRRNAEASAPPPVEAAPQEAA